MSSSPSLPNSSEKISLYGTHMAALPLDVVIVGCGLGGLAATYCLLQAGHRVTVIESALASNEIGAGILMPPNSSRLLRRWGLAYLLEQVSVRHEAAVTRRYNTGERIGYSRIRETADGAPHCCLHRVDLHRILLDLVLPNITLRFGSTVIGCNPDSLSPSVTLVSEEIIRADLIVGADGIKSCIQQVVIGKPSKLDHTGYAAYRAVIPTSLLLKDKELTEFVEKPQLTCWLGPGRRVAAYPICGNNEYNLVLVHPDDGSVESLTAEESADKMRQNFGDFEPRVQELLKLVNTTREWRLLDRKSLDKWVHDSGRVVLLGDACHPMLPFQAQGAAMAMEDAAVLGNLLSRLSHPSQIKHLLLTYQHLRLPRTADTQLRSRLNGDTFHLPDGPAQIERDKVMRIVAEAEFTGNDEAVLNNPCLLADRKRNLAVFEYDADLEVDKWWSEKGEKELARLADSPLDP